MRNLIKISLLLLFLMFGLTPKAQILISLVFGEALNTPKIEFGMVGGLNRSYLTDLSGSEWPGECKPHPGCDHEKLFPEFLHENTYRIRYKTRKELRWVEKEIELI